MQATRGSEEIGRRILSIWDKFLLHAISVDRERHPRVPQHRTASVPVSRNAVIASTTTQVGAPRPIAVAPRKLADKVAAATSVLVRVRRSERAMLC